MNLIDPAVRAGVTLHLSQITKRFGRHEVVSDLDLEVRKGEFISVLGPSGCGKTTALRMIAGFEHPTTGRILIDGRDVSRLRPDQRNLGMVFQSYALFPNMSVAANVGFGLKIAAMADRNIQRRVAEMLELVGLTGLERRFPYELSGGQQQRVALARALATKPAMLLLDEPLSALDAKIRLSLREQIRDVQTELGITTLFVTHDQEEALSMSDRVAVMNSGRVEQFGTPLEIYNRPTTRFVASFVGTLSILKARLLDPARGVVEVATATFKNLEIPRGVARGGHLSLAVRPEAIRFGVYKGDVILRGKVIGVGFYGSVIRVRLIVGNETITIDTFNTPLSSPPLRGEDVDISIDPKSVFVMRAE
ncbi:ABC transporter ATP-binding protein (plasmid) [Rhizobium sp. 32-5/1]|uniref:ABC transporter ATP-binding protein n=1 Tax=Rhizobium sp. 32-5/1 TaxID=3019602 RepID=UPI00240D6D70|nr:ABC transporter ATP-binding protein [Rhizobium sp. 32-5/1]WEZ86146.1 ABC transporter ATP-binding protein [Rhizobium sp. 32-5/1]